MKFIFIASILFNVLYCQQYRGAELRTLDSFLYGRFDVRFKPAQGDGLVSSFFTYNDDNPNTPWAEIDVEVLGVYHNVVDFNTITRGQDSHIRQHYVDFNPHLNFHTYSFEWTPDYVAWFIDNEEVYRQTGSHIDSLFMIMLVIQHIRLEKEIVVRTLTLHFLGKMILILLIIIDGKKVMTILGEEINHSSLMRTFILKMVT